MKKAIIFSLLVVLLSVAVVAHLASDAHGFKGSSSDYKEGYTMHEMMGAGTYEDFAEYMERIGFMAMNMTSNPEEFKSIQEHHNYIKEKGYHGDMENGKLNRHHGTYTMSKCIGG